MRIFCPEPLSTQNIFTSFLYRFSPETTIGGLFKENLPPNFFEHDVEYVDTPQEAQAILLPNNFLRLDSDAEAYIKKYATLAKANTISIYAFSCGDLSDILEFDPHVTVFKYSLYRSQIRSNEVSTPTLTEDLGRKGISLREKNEIPTVSFCGKAGFGSTREHVATFVRRIKYEILSVVHPVLRARIRGIYWRIWALRACAASPLLKTYFVLRKTFSGAMRTIEVPPEQARKEFTDSVLMSDFVLAPKGDGNYSNRFLEALSMGRIPVLIDTDAVLPFEDVIDYEKIVVRVPMTKVSQTPTYIRAFYDSLNKDEWEKRQQMARQTFEHYLRQDSFFREYFSKYRETTS